MPSPLHRISLLAVLVAATALALLLPAARADAVPPAVINPPQLFSVSASDHAWYEPCADDFESTPNVIILCTGEQIIGDRGDWTDEGSLTFTLDWLSCDVDGANCKVTSTFPGTSDMTDPLTLGPDQLNRTVRLRVTATGPDGSTIATSERTTVIQRGPTTRPIVQTAPSIDGDPWPPVSGQVVNGRIGVWDDVYKEYIYDASWQRCNADGLQCATISTQRLDGPNDPVFRTSTSSDVGYTLRLAVTATAYDRGDDAIESQVAYSAPTPVVGSGGPPVNLELPLLLVGSYKVPAVPVSGPVNPGDVLTATTGRWTMNDALVVNWLRCKRDGTTCASIPGADAFPGQPARQGYIVAAADLGSSIRADVSATSFLGTATVRTPAARVGPDTTDPGKGGGGSTVKERATVRVRSAKLTGSGKTLAVYLTLGAPGKVKVTAKGGGTTLGKTSRELGKGKVAITVKLSKKALKLLKGGKKVKTTLALTLRTDAGNQGSLRQSVTLRGASR